MVRLYAWVMIVTTGLTVVVALLATRTVPQYSASAEVLIDPTITPSGNYISPSMPTEQRVATSTDVVSTAAARLGITPVQALGHLSVTVPVDTQVLVMKYTDDTPAEALAGATAIAQTYIKDRNPANGKNVVASLVGPPKLPSGPVTTNYPVVFGVAVLGGLLIGFGLAWTWDRLRGRVITISDAEQYTDLDALAVLPGSSLAVERRTSAGLFHLDSLAARVLGQVEDQPQPSVLVTGVGPDCGITTVAAQTALAMARMGRVVILVTADLDVIAKLSPDREPTYESPQLGLHIVAVREWDGGGVAAAELMSLLRELHDRLPEALLVIDGPPAWQSAGIALRADRILLVVALGQSSRTATSAAVQALDHCTDKLVGLVITSPRGRIRGVLASVRTWAAHTARRIMSRVAPPAPASSAPLVLRGWNGLMGADAPSSVTAAERISVVGRVSVPHPNGKSTRSSST
jgi:capsular polysaccharide biosynthesis protein